MPRSARAERLENRLKRMAEHRLLQQRVDVYRKLLREDPLKLVRMQEDQAMGTSVDVVGIKIHDDQKRNEAEWETFRQREWNADMETVVENAVLTNTVPPLPPLYSDE
jgi:hypothetical protein